MRRTSPRKDNLMKRTDISARAVTERLLDWCDQASSAGRRRRADDLLVLAWSAYDRPSGQAETPPAS
jgi:hypothetical protein